MAFACTPAQFISNLGSLAPHFDEGWLHDWSPMESAFNGKHLTSTWKLGTGDAHIRTRITIGYPNLTAPKAQISSANCANDPCSPPTDHVAFGTNRSEHFMTQWAKNTQPFCITQLRYQYDPAGQLKEIIDGLRKIPQMETANFIRSRALTLSEGVAIAGPVTAGIPNTFVPIINTNIDNEAVTIDLGSAAALPTSRLTFPYLDWITATLDLGGYHEKPSGLAQGVFNLITDRYEWFNLTNGNASMKNMMALTEAGQASGLYKIGQGVQVPFGNYAPSPDMVPMRYQLMPGGSGGLLNRVEPMINVQTGTTGTRQIPNPAWVAADYQLSFIWHPQALMVHMPDYGKIHPLVPSINSAMYGKWRSVDDPVMVYENPDGTTCTMNNVDRNKFYLRVNFEMGAEYIEPNMIIPILHRTGSSQLRAITNDIPCGSGTSYVAQSYSDDPVLCSV